MTELLFLAHRIPYPPNRGDKIRSWHVLEHLARFATVHLAAFADDARDAAHLAGLREALGGALGEALVEPVRADRIGWAMRALRRGEPVNLAAFHSASIHRFVGRLLERPQLATIYAFSVQMAQFVPPGAKPRFVMDFVDFDSAKYQGYAAGFPTPRRLVYRREAPLLLAHERATAERADLSLFISEAERALFIEQARPRGGDIRVLPNGIDLGHYDPALAFAPPLDPPSGGPLIVFTGQMSYQPNVEAVAEFADRTMPLVRAACPQARFAIVGRDPPAAVRRLAGRDDVIVTGEVADVRPWLAAAALVVAPLKLARGVQNKVLEAMAMGRPVVASPAAFTGIDAQPGRDLLVAQGAARQAEAVLSLLGDRALADRIGLAARRRMEAVYGWEAQLAPLAGLAGLEPAQAAA